MTNPKQLVDGPPCLKVILQQLLAQLSFPICSSSTGNNGHYAFTLLSPPGAGRARVEQVLCYLLKLEAAARTAGLRGTVLGPGG